MRSDDRQEHHKFDNNPRNNKGNNNKRLKGNPRSEKSDHVFTVSKADFERLNNWKATKSKQGNSSKKSAKSLPLLNLRLLESAINFKIMENAKDRTVLTSTWSKGILRTTCKWFHIEDLNQSEMDVVTEDKPI